MSFRTRIVLATAMLITVLFSIGGTVMVHTTFQASLEKEEVEAVESNELILRLVQYVWEEGTWLDEDELVSTVKNIGTQMNVDCLRMTCEGEEIFAYQGQEKLADSLEEEVQVEENQVTITYFTAPASGHYLRTTTQFSLYGKAYYLDMGRSLQTIYDVREEQFRVFQKIFFVLFCVGVAVAWLLATWLTRTLRKLTKAAKEFGAGNLSYRAEIKSKDEIGELSEAFDKMAGELENKIGLLKESAEQKEMFMGAFTHELKTPMTSIIGYADLLRTQKLSKRDEADALNYIFSEAKRLENMSLKMLDLFVVDKKEWELKECSPGKLVLHVTSHLQNIYKKNGVAIKVNVENGVCFLEHDLFQTLLINLLDNARKSMEQGGQIDVEVAMTKQGCRLVVADSGTGIPEEALKHLTEAFYRVDKARARKRGSAGLGLALCDKITTLHNGNIAFESKENVGTKVTVTLNGGRHEE